MYVDEYDGRDDPVIENGNGLCGGACATDDSRIQSGNENDLHASFDVHVV